MFSEPCVWPEGQGVSPGGSGGEMRPQLGFPEPDWNHLLGGIGGLLGQDGPSV